jgi:UDP-N-acetylmuramoyl-tripeptide--D-alanyl-D-alanine ligase
MRKWQLGELARATEAELQGGGQPPGGGESVLVAAVGTDTRSLPPDSLFVALRGDRFDGHQFVLAAVAAGARAVMIDDKAAPALAALPVPRLIVRDTLRALGDLAHHVRTAHGLPVVAVTGSNGKTTTKELCAAALGATGKVHKTQGNLNNLVGVPLTLLAWPEDCPLGVVEMGMNAPGEIARLCEIAAPQVGIITNVAPAHLEGLGTIEAVAQAKGELFLGLPDGATAVVNADDMHIVSLAERVDRKRRGATLRFGHGVDCDVRLQSHTHDEHGLRAELVAMGHRLTLELPLWGGHNAMNAAGALAVGVALGVPVLRLAEAMATVRLPSGRLRLRRGLRLRGGRVIHLVDDTYNANPHSMRAAFATLVDLAGTARRIAVVGDMLELGPTGMALHHEVGAAAAASGVQWLLGQGPLTRALVQGASEAGSQAVHFDDTASLADALLAGLRDGDWVLVKGSRGSRMERVVQALEACAEERPAEAGSGQSH